MDAPVLLTGATGYIGGRLLRHFEEAGRPASGWRGIPNASRQPDQRRRSSRVIASMRRRWVSPSRAWTRPTTWCTPCRSAPISRRWIGMQLQTSAARRLVLASGASSIWAAWPIRRVRSPAISRVGPKPDPSCAPVASRSSSSGHRSWWRRQSVVPDDRGAGGAAARHGARGGSRR